MADDFINPFDATPAAPAAPKTDSFVNPFEAKSSEPSNKFYYARDTSQDIPFSEKVKAIDYGGLTGLVGGLGELETLGAYTLPEALGLREEGSRDQYRGRETIFPTVKEAKYVVGKLGINEPDERVREYQTGGQFLGETLGGMPGVLKGGVKAILGVPSATSEAAARTAEKLGFKLSPAQVKQDVPSGAQGATGWSAQNQTKANQLVSKETGKEVSEISPTFIRERLSDLGDEFNKVYQGRIFNIDQPAVDAINTIAQIQEALPGTARVPAVRQTAQNIIDNFSALAGQPGARPGTFAIEGDALQTMRNDLMAAARTTSNRQDARHIYELIDEIDGSIARNHPQDAATLNRIRPQYRSTVVLEDLIGNGGIKQGNVSLDRLGNMLGSRRGGVRKTGDLDELGEIGRQLQIKARWESAGAQGTPGEDILKKALGTTIGGIESLTGLRSRAARAAQRKYGRTPTSATERTGVVSGVGGATEPLTREDE